MSRTVIELPELRDRLHVFRDREHAGRVLAGMLSEYRESNALILAIPAGGVPVAAAMAEVLGLPLDVCVVSKILLPWTTEAGFGAVAFDGTLWINQEYLDYYQMTPEQIETATETARQKVIRRVERFRGNRPLPQVSGRPVILVRCPPWRAKRRRVVPGSREATRDTRRAEGAKGDPKGASERGVQSYGRPVCSRNELAMLWRNAG